MLENRKSMPVEMMRRWWIGEDGNVRGPFGAGYIVVAIKTGTVRLNALACLEGTQEWRTVGDWSDFRSALEASHPKLPSGPSTASSLTYAGFWDRVRALFLDGLILFLFTEINRYWIWFGDFWTKESGIDLLYLIVVCVYFSAFESSGWQATPGKKAMGIKVTDYRGQRISFGRAAVRYFGKTLSFSIIMIGFLMAAFTERKQALHDIVAGCFVVYRDPPSGLRAFQRDLPPA
jgi:uncharacterized RDD family membrane protein YckC